MPEFPTEDLHSPLVQERDADFPHAPSGWSRGDAEALAKDDGITLGADHWEVVKALQQFFARNERPNVRDLHDALGEKFHPKGGMKYLYELCPGGPVAQGCRLAGLPVPAGAVDKSFGSVQ